MMAGNKKPKAEDKVCIGAITGVRGLRGEVRIKSFTADPDGVAAYGQVTDEAGERAYRIRVTGHVKGRVIARLDGIDDRDAAESLKGTKLYVPRNILPLAVTYDHRWIDGADAARFLRWIAEALENPLLMSLEH